ncbi:lysophospholipid acyltransferase family protein [Odoribacter sp. OttesenSCG-928-J03]|nr:lysophospholipid acyltransferase family protein [Odoribacter sp. OttesenSCG-928-J03]MDL2283139.1 lysophospholipid acyltransferase family protein [Odoribacter sp. OttesenSCG-928-G04]MDL2330495.1 lysophospholipid acyltransferase family protein [Odoribacter sp. OttesenSCG-928-A06]
MKKKKDRNNLIESEDLLKASGGLNRFGGSLVAKALMHLLGFNKLNKLYSNLDGKSPEEFLDQLIDELGVHIEINDEDLQKIPASGNFITVSNHPFGGIDGIILIRLLSKIRPDYKVMANFLLKKIEPIKDYFLGVNPFEDQKKISSTSGIKEALRHLEAGHPLGMFPAGEVSAYQADSNIIEDKEWSQSAIKMIKKAKLPVVPVYFKGSNSLLFYLLGLIHPILRTVKLPSELLNKKNTVIKVRIGSPISVETQDSFTDIIQYGKFLRAKTYLLGSSLEVKKFFLKSQRAARKVEKVADAVNPAVLKKEVAGVAEDCLLFKIKNYSVYCAPSVKIPNVLNEIGRLRELTFRAVGEGTNRSVDMDEYDLYYDHLFIWDEEADKIVGAYRLGKGKDIMERYGIHGFYINSLFKMKKPMMPILCASLELGRSFITEEYQRKPLPLFMLWKGILYFLLKNPEYRYLLGPVTISGKYSEMSKDLIMRFIKQNYFNEELAKSVSPRSKYRVKAHDEDVDLMLKATHNDIGVLDKMIGDIELSNDKLPVLLKKYISLNARMIGFNIDPKFNMCLDGLLILDIFEVPITTIESLSKEFNDDSILSRFSAENIEL